MRVLIILDQYFPTGNANAICVKNLVDAFGDNEYYIVCEGATNCSYTYDKEFVNSVCVKTPKRTIFHKVISFFKLLFSYNISFKKADIFYKKSLEIIHTKKIYMVIAICRPFFTAQVIHKIKNELPMIKSYIFFFDTPGMSVYKSHFLDSIWKKRTKAFLNKVITNGVTGVFMDYSMSFCRELLIGVKDNVEVHNLPCFIPINIEKNISQTKTIVYAGTLDKTYRNPNKVLLFLLDVIVRYRLPYKIKLYTKGCEEELKKLKEMYCEQIELHGLVDIKEIDRVYSDASTFLSIGNHLLKQLPSKIFSYFSTGKPVLNFYFDYDDLSLKYFLKYNNSISVNINEISSYEEKLVLFLNNYQALDYQTLQKLFLENQPIAYRHIFEK